MLFWLPLQVAVAKQRHVVPAVLVMNSWLAVRWSRLQESSLRPNEEVGHSARPGLQRQPHVMVKG